MFSKSETTPKAERIQKDHESGQKTLIPNNNRKSRNISIQSLDYSFIDSSPIKSKTYLGPISNISKYCKHTQLIEMLSYASTAPRPILSSESTSPIIYHISEKGSEFSLLSHLLLQHQRQLLQAIKTYTHSLLCTLPTTNTLGFLSNSLNYNKIRLLFMTGSPTQLQQICNFGFKTTEINPKSLILASSIENCEKFICNSGNMNLLIVLVSRNNLQKIHRGVYSVNDLLVIVPVYYLEYRHIE